MATKKYKVGYFSDDESIYLLVGVIIYGKKWTKIITEFRNKFELKRTRYSLLHRFTTLTLRKNRLLFDRLLLIAKVKARNYQMQHGIDQVFDQKLEIKNKKGIH